MMDPEFVSVLGKALPALLLAIFWFWETKRPFKETSDRWTHAGRNVTLALANTVILAFTVGIATTAMAEWAVGRGYGLLSLWPLDPIPKAVAALLMLDAWMYCWHRANHVVPVLWRFHRMHHSDPAMDVTTATRFHLGEHLGSAALRIALIPIAGWEVWHFVLFDMLVIAMTQFHHANISLGQWDRPLRLLIVSPDMHKVHHSDHQPETDSNYSTILSVWDRIAGTFTMRQDLGALVFGLREFKDPKWQKWQGLWKTPFISVRNDATTVDVRIRPPEREN
jgi:sterol desaturase/sphingolipid hydroxylase (fatty acid hydroxylase superfamily)